MEYPVIEAGKLIQRLEPPAGTVRMVLDTDTYNEVDDQFAVVQALLSTDSVRVEALYAAPFYNSRSSGPAEGMELSFQEILQLLERLEIDPQGLVFKGSPAYLGNGGEPVESDATRDLIRRAMASDDDDPLYVVAIGAITNIASAIMLEPAIIGKIVVVWLGGHALNWPDTREFNLRQDVAAARLVFDCGVPLVLIPCQGVAFRLLTTTSEAEQYLKGCGPVGDFLFQRFYEYSDNHYAYSKVIWDMAAVAYLLDSRWTPSYLVHSPVLTDQVTWSVDANRHFIRCVYDLDRDQIFGDFFRKLRDFSGAKEG